MMTSTEAWAQQVLGWVRAANWMRALQAIRDARELSHLDLLEAWLVQHDLLWRLNDDLPKAIASRRQALTSSASTPSMDCSG
jgi:hypothetical protein